MINLMIFKRAHEHHGPGIISFYHNSRFNIFCINNSLTSDLLPGIFFGCVTKHLNLIACLNLVEYSEVNCMQLNIKLNYICYNLIKHSMRIFRLACKQVSINIKQHQ